VLVSESKEDDVKGDLSSKRIRFEISLPMGPFEEVGVSDE